MSLLKIYMIYLFVCAILPINIFVRLVLWLDNILIFSLNFFPFFDQFDHLLTFLMSSFSSLYLIFCFQYICSFSMLDGFVNLSTASLSYISILLIFILQLYEEMGVSYYPHVEFHGGWNPSYMFCFFFWIWDVLLIVRQFL